MQKAMGCAVSAAVVLLTLLVGVADVCAQQRSGGPTDTGGFVVERVDNPRVARNEIFAAFEQYRSPRVWELRERHHLDDVVAGEQDEFTRQVLLRHWIRSAITINDRHPTPVRGDAFAILDAALKGGQFHCHHFMLVQHAVMNSFGYPCRSLGVGPGSRERSGHHGVNEVWSNTYCKWYVSDAKYDCHFEKEDGIPLSALELRDEYHKNQGADVSTVIGPDRKAVRGPGGWSEDRVGTYNWCSWTLSTNSFTNSPNRASSALVIYEDDYTRNNTWYRGRRPNWAYRADAFIPVRHREWIEWTPNVVDVSVEIKPGPSNTNAPGYWAHCTVRSWTPNFKEYQLKAGEGDWHPVDEEFAVPLYANTNEFRVRSANLFGVTGPEHLVRIRGQRG